MVEPQLRGVRSKEKIHGDGDQLWRVEKLAWPLGLAGEGGGTYDLCDVQLFKENAGLNFPNDRANM